HIERRPPLLLLCLGLVGFGTGTWSNFGPMFGELFPTSVRTTAVGTVFNAARGVQFVTPLVVTLVARRWGLGGGIALAAAFALAARTAAGCRYPGRSSPCDPRPIRAGSGSPSSP